MIWREINGFDGYFINENGDVRSIKRGKQKVLKPALSGCGYLNVVLMRDNKRFAKKIHRLVAENFLPLDGSRTHVNHKDGNKTNNHIDNLEWCNRSENVVHAIKTGLLKAKTGIHNKRFTLTVEQVLTLMTLPRTTKNGRGSYATNRKLSEMWGVSEGTISRIRNGKYNPLNIE